MSGVPLTPTVVMEPRFFFLADPETGKIIEVQETLESGNTYTIPKLNLEKYIEGKKKEHEEVDEKEERKEFVLSAQPRTRLFKSAFGYIEVICALQITHENEKNIFVFKDQE